MIFTILFAGIILCLIYGIKETMEKWDGEDE